MSPEPIQGRLGPGGGGEEEDLSPPSVLSLGPPLSSSDDEVDHNDSENFAVEYLPLSQDPEDETEAGQNSLSGLMQALATHGPNVIPGGGDEEHQGGGGGREGVETEISSQTDDLMQVSAQIREVETRQEQTAVWSSRPSQSDPLELDRGRLEEIKSAMASFTLPLSSIPAWARNLSDEDWESQIADLLAKPTHK